jgi:hypothetical protein
MGAQYGRPVAVSSVPDASKSWRLRISLRQNRWLYDEMVNRTSTAFGGIGPTSMSVHSFHPDGSMALVVNFQTLTGVYHRARGTSTVRTPCSSWSMRL